MVQSIFKRLHDSATLTAPTSIGVLPQDQYPNKPQPILAFSNRDTELQTPHDLIGINVDDLDSDQAQQWEAEKEMLEQSISSQLTLTTNGLNSLSTDGKPIYCSSCYRT